MSIANAMLVIAGPTASGKSWLAARLAARLGGTVINADSLQVYEALPILTAAPGLELTSLAPHVLYGVLDPAARSSAAWWAAAARGEIARSHAAGRPAVLVGGTGLYLEALMQGLAALPAIAPAVREQAIAELNSMGRNAFFARLVAADPDSRRLSPGDTQRILRAWEVYLATGSSLAEWQARAGVRHAPFPCRSVVLLPPREQLRARCDARFEGMMAGGVLREVEAFLARHDASSPAARALGFLPLAASLAGEISLAEARARGQAQTRQYAKRQSTWFRNRFCRLNPTAVVAEQADEALLDRIEAAFTRI